MPRTESAAWVCLACLRDANIHPAPAEEMLMLQTAHSRSSMRLPTATTDCGILSVGDGLLDCNYSTRPCFCPYHQRCSTLLVCGFPSEALATYWLKVAHFKHSYHVPPKFGGLKLLQHSQPGVCTACLSLSKVFMSPKWKNCFSRKMVTGRIRL